MKKNLDITKPPYSKKLLPVPAYQLYFAKCTLALRYIEFPL